MQSFPAVRLALALGLLALITCNAASAQATGFSSLEERMTGEEFNAAGLHKLDAEELAALNRWIRQHSLGTEEPTAQQSQGLPDRPGELPPIDRMARQAFQSRIVGEFSGWTGDTRFELENGMVWQQSERDRYRVEPVLNPVVTIEPGFGGSWTLSVEGHNRGIRVERVK